MPQPYTADTTPKAKRTDSGQGRKANGKASPGRPPGPHAQSPAPKLQVKKMSWWHEALVDWMLLNPDKNKKEMAEAFGKDYQTIVVITNSEVFKARFEQARAGLTSRVLATAKERLEGVANGSLGALADRIHADADKIPTKELREIADMSLRNLGYGPQGSSGGVQVFAPGSQFVQVPQEVLERSRQAMLARRAGGQDNGTLIEHKPQGEVSLDNEHNDDACATRLSSRGGG